MGIHLDQRGDDGLALFIDGDLQFDTRDEAYYHESLALPALTLARRGAADGLRVMILGGGDGLALRECLRFPGVARVTLVDYSAEMLDLGRTRLAELNAHAFEDTRVEVVCGDAWDYLADAQPCDVLLADLTVPRRPEDGRLQTVEGFARLRRCLTPEGVAALNGLSPQHTPEAFWCLRRTMRAAHLFSLPYRVPLPTFWEQGYGVWGFFLAARRPLRRQMLRDLHCPVPTRQADFAALHRLAHFRREEWHLEARVPTNTLTRPCLLPLLLNPRHRGSAEPSTAPPPPEVVDEPYPLDGLFSLLTVMHPYHTHEMVEMLAAEVAGTVRRLDLDRLVSALLERAARLPGELVEELTRLRDFLRGRVGGLERFGLWCQRVLVILFLIITVANLLSPDTAFGKGSFGAAHASFGHASFSRGGGFSGAGGSFGHAGEGFGGGGRVGGSFGSPGGARVQAGGFRGDYRSGHVIDITGNSFAGRTFRYDPDNVHFVNWRGGYGGGYYGGGRPDAPEQPAVFAVAPDVLVMENGDVVVTVAENAYLVASQGKLTLLNAKGGAPLAEMYPDPNLFARLHDEVLNQRKTVSSELELRRDWLGWVGWAHLLPTVSADRDEADNLDDLGERLDKASERLGTPPTAENLPPVSPGAVELFMGAYLLPDGEVVLRQPDGSWLHTEGRRLWTTSPDNAQSAPSELAGAVSSVMTKLQKEMTGDAAAAATDLDSLDKELAALRSDLGQYQNLSLEFGPLYEVDYGIESITAADAIARTQRDIDQDEADKARLVAERDKSAADLASLRSAAPRFVAP